MTALLVIAGGSVGAIARWGTDRAVQSRHRGDLPWGTFVINMIGSFVLGVVLAATTSVAWLALLGTGFCGAFTTFSTFAYEAVRLTETGRVRSASTYVVGSLVVGLALVALGWWVGGTVGG